MLAKIQAAAKIESQNIMNSANQIQATSIGEGREIKESGGVRLRRLSWWSVHRKSPLNSRERELRRGPREGGGREGDRRMKWMEWLQPAWSTPSKDHLNKKPLPPPRATLV